MPNYFIDVACTNTLCLVERNGMEKVVTGILLDEEDNVVTVKRPVFAGMTVSWGGSAETSVKAVTNVPCFHKIAIADIKAGGTVKKYGHSIGRATALIPKGTHVHIQNCAGTSVEEIQ